MSGPIGFYRTFQSLLRGRAIEGVLTSGMACVEYGLQQNTKDTDWIVAPALIEKLVVLFGDLERGVSGGNWRISYRGLFGAPLDAEYLAGGWTSHVAAFDEPESAEWHLYFFGRPPPARPHRSGAVLRDPRPRSRRRQGPLGSDALRRTHAGTGLVSRPLQHARRPLAVAGGTRRRRRSRLTAVTPTCILSPCTSGFRARLQ